ncbi:hypothetical protein THASP1DRAFT_24074 [Thamnocephalis sphaerospora]|uniref:Uncharacterized protein n=1 Tax=Thamnocephalis sphaerospora TaxID=78915 RepID=A0A4P9XPC9_9FUNG|nr:hypothetical protein THASP1DRAFT_24074 [Thamnocephalis sphaerospora]|eukprot:RKP07838.1 hypothetical protein THASP1DRAFT_24074 [Thamnocephalis sphaerospora]
MAPLPLALRCGVNAFRRCPVRATNVFACLSPLFQLLCPLHIMNHDDRFDYPADAVIQAVLRRQVSDVETTLGPYLKAGFAWWNPARFLQPLFARTQPPGNERAYDVEQRDLDNGWPRTISGMFGDMFGGMLGWEPEARLNEHWRRMMNNDPWRTHGGLRPDDMPRSLYDVFVEDEREQTGVLSPDDKDSAEHPSPPSSVSVIVTRRPDGMVETRKEMRWPDGHKQVTVTLENTTSGQREETRQGNES